MEIKRESLHKLIDQLPDEKINEAHALLKGLLAEHNELAKALDYVLKNYKEVLDNLRNR